MFYQWSDLHFVFKYYGTGGDACYPGFPSPGATVRHGSPSAS